MVSMSRTWLSVMRWVSPHWFVSRLDRDAVGEDGERYTWTRILVIDVRDGRLASMCMFELEDEGAAFAYAEEQARAATSRLGVRNLASDTFDVVCRAMRDHDADAAVRMYSKTYVYEDHRRFSGGPDKRTRCDADGYRARLRAVPSSRMAHTGRPGRASGDALDSPVGRRRKRNVGSAGHRGRPPRADHISGPLRRGRLRKRIPRTRKALLRRGRRGVRRTRRHVDAMDGSP